MAWTFPSNQKKIWVSNIPSLQNRHDLLQTNLHILTIENDEENTISLLNYRPTYMQSLLLQAREAEKHKFIVENDIPCHRLTTQPQTVILESIIKVASSLSPMTHIGTTSSESIETLESKNSHRLVPFRPKLPRTLRSNQLPVSSLSYKIIAGRPITTEVTTINVGSMPHYLPSLSSLETFFTLPGPRMDPVHSVVWAYTTFYTYPYVSHELSQSS